VREEEKRDERVMRCENECMQSTVMALKRDEKEGFDKL
jgi:hypothetical protein